MDALLRSILDDDREKVHELTTADSSLVSRRVSEARFYDQKIFHWLYVGDTSLHLAAAGYRVEIVKLLLAAGSDPNASMNHRHSGPLHYAADGYIIGPAWDEERQAKTIECLLGAGADVNAQDKNGAAALHRAVRTRCAAAARVLLEAGADPSLRNKAGSSAFHLAVQNTGRGGTGTDEARAAQRQIIEEFLRFGVSPSIRDGKGKTVLDWAKSAWIREMFEGEAL
jgi:Ankyrin repeats (3 copies)/Ankyrin repeat